MVTKVTFKYTDIRGDIKVGTVNENDKPIDIGLYDIQVDHRIFFQEAKRGGVDDLFVPDKSSVGPHTAEVEVIRSSYDSAYFGLPVWYGTCVYDRGNNNDCYPSRFSPVPQVTNYPGPPSRDFYVVPAPVQAKKVTKVVFKYGGNGGPQPGTLSVISCSASPNPANINDTVMWRANGVSGGNGIGSYSYQWYENGDPIIPNINRSEITTEYRTQGTYNTFVRVTSGNQSVTSPPCFVTINPPISSSVTVTLSANPTRTSRGGFSDLTWDVTGAASCIASNGSTSSWRNVPNKSATNGRYTERVTGIPRTTTFTITCSNANASATATANATVRVESTSEF